MIDFDCTLTCNTCTKKIHLSRPMHYIGSIPIPIRIMQPNLPGTNFVQLMAEFRWDLKNSEISESLAANRLGIDTKSLHIIPRYIGFGAFRKPVKEMTLQLAVPSAPGIITPFTVHIIPDLSENYFAIARDIFYKRFVSILLPETAFCILHRNSEPEGRECARIPNTATFGLEILEMNMTPPVIDVSETGIGIICAGQMNTGQKLTINVKSNNCNFMLSAFVQWSNEHNASWKTGLKIDRAGNGTNGDAHKFAEEIRKYYLQSIFAM